MSRLSSIRLLVQDGLYYLTEHADAEALADDFDIYDVEAAVLTGRIRRTWPREGKHEVVGRALDGRAMGVVLRVTPSGKARIITVYEDHPGRRHGA